MYLYLHDYMLIATLQMPPHSRLGARPCAGTDPAQCSPTRRRELAEDLRDFVWAELPPLQRRFEQRGRLPGRPTARDRKSAAHGTTAPAPHPPTTPHPP